MDDQTGRESAYAAPASRRKRWQWRFLRRFLPDPRPREFWYLLASRLLARLVSLGLVVALAHQLAAITWALVPGARLDAGAPVASPGSVPSQPTEAPLVNVQPIIDAHLFGEYVAISAPSPIEAAPETTLDLMLKATVADSQDDGFGAAVIAIAGTERTYRVNEELEGTGGAVLHVIHPDHVILNVGGQFEKLPLPLSQAAQSDATAVLARLMPRAPVAASAASLNEHAARLARIMHVVPHVVQGAVVGFRVNPASDGEQFEALGLEPGDVITEINGTALTNAGQAIEVFERLGESMQANATLLRNGTPQLLTMDTSFLAVPNARP